MFVYPIKRFSRKKFVGFLCRQKLADMTGPNRHSDSAIFWLMMDESRYECTELYSARKAGPTLCDSVFLISPLPSPLLFLPFFILFLFLFYFFTLSSPVWTNSLSRCCFLKIALIFVCFVFLQKISFNFFCLEKINELIQPANGQDIFMDSAFFFYTY